LLATTLATTITATAGVTAHRQPPDLAHHWNTVDRIVAAQQTADRQQARIRRLRHELRATKRLLRKRWQPTVDYALRLASAVTGVSYRQLQTVSWCESTHNPYAENGKYRGLFQLGWSPFGFSPFDPVANALSAAMTVRHDGGWRQWECQP
jgi:hypothetical protein